MVVPLNRGIRRSARLAVAWAGVFAAAAVLVVVSPRPARIAAAVDDPAAWVLTRGLDLAVIDLLALLAWTCGAWVVVGFALALLAHVPGVVGRSFGRVAVRVTPALARRAVAGLLGLTAVTAGMGAGTASAGQAPMTSPVVVASAAPTGQAATGQTAAGSDAWAGWSRPAVGVAPSLDWPGTPAASSAPAELVSAPTADWPLDAAPRLVTAAPLRAAVAQAEPVVVQRGDTLWSIVARQLGPTATGAEVAASWPRWHEANRDLIGPNPHRLLPGQRLLPPA